MRQLKWIAVAVAAGMLAVPGTGHAQSAGGGNEAQVAPTPDQAKAIAAYRAKMNQIEAGLHPRTGAIELPEAKAMLNLGEGYYFLPADDAKTVLTQAWGNPPEASADVLGMIFPAGRTFHDDGWGAVVRYDESGHVDDKDAADQDYAAVLRQMQESEVESNKQAREKGYAESTTIGWAQPPSYDAASKTLIWARQLRFSGASADTLNYDVRRLGRTGVLSLNMVDTMGNLESVRAAAAGLGQTASFASGGGYGDFDRKTDKMADYGLAGLVAAGAGLLIAKKLGLIGIVLLFLKKFIIIGIAAAAGGWGWLKRKLGRGKAEEVADKQPHEEDAEPVAEPQPGPVAEPEATERPALTELS